MSYTEGIWDQWTSDTYHQSSPTLAKFLSSYLSEDYMVLDFGCGNGFYVHELDKEGFLCYGIEGANLNNFLHKNILIKDLSKPIDLSNDLESSIAIGGSVLSLEVGEHIPKDFEQVFIDNITKHCNSKLILSWALPGQPGIGHVNCQPQEYIISEIERRGFVHLAMDTKYARTQIDDNCDWFRRTLLIFERR